MPRRWAIGTVLASTLAISCGPEEHRAPVRETEQPVQWIETDELGASNRPYFGSSVCNDADTAVVGAAPNAAYVYT